VRAERADRIHDTIRPAKLGPAVNVLNGFSQPSGD
jgi:hypothetical protein